MNAFFVVLLACKSVDRGKFFCMKRVSASYKMFFGPRFYTPIKLQKMHSILNSWQVVLDTTLCDKKVRNNTQLITHSHNQNLVNYFIICWCRMVFWTWWYIHTRVDFYPWYIEPPCIVIWNLFISNQETVRGSIYHGRGVHF